MSYQVLARKWRPQSFTDLIGQDHIRSTLLNAIRHDRVGHAYLFVGTRGIGKTTSARIFAKALNCLNPAEDREPCNTCANCVGITQGNSTDVIEIDGASNNSVDDVRRIREGVNYTPASSRFKIYILDEVHMLSTAAWNALLKTLEEPPEHVKFLFATTEVHRVLPTILSRCQRMELRRIPDTLIAKRLEYIAGLEKVSIQQDALMAIARVANGGMRDALSILDQAVAFCFDQSAISESDITDVFGLTSAADLHASLGAILKNDARTLIEIIHKLARSARNLEQLYADLFSVARDILIVQESPEAQAILELDAESFGRLQQLAALVNQRTCQRLVEGFLDNEGRLRHTLNKRAVLEITLLRIMRDAHAFSIEEAIERFQNLRGAIPATDEKKKS